MSTAKQPSSNRNRKAKTESVKANPSPAAQAEPIQFIPHSSLKPSPLNPRKRVEEQALADLAESIAAKGVLQNLVARPKGNSYEIAAGERRYRAVGLLIEQGRLPKDTPLPVRVQELSDLELVELATSENSVRADMHPLEEAEAYSTMTRLGADIPSIALRMGKSEQMVKRRLALHERLCEEAKQALFDNAISLAQAQQLTAASSELQHYLLEHSPAQAPQGGSRRSLRDSPPAR